MNRLTGIAAIALPLVGLGAIWAWTDVWTREGTDWDVPVRGYDPRDLLRGHYIEFQYEWPLEGEDWAYAETQYCIIGTPPKVEQLVEQQDGQDCAYPAKVYLGSVYGDDGLRTGRLYIPQTRSRELEDKLRDPGLRGIVTVRQRADGRILPKSIRFRELTEQEVAELEAERVENGRTIDRPIDDEPVIVGPDPAQ